MGTGRDIFAGIPGGGVSMHISSDLLAWRGGKQREGRERTGSFGVWGAAWGGMHKSRYFGCAMSCVESMGLLGETTVLTRPDHG